MDSLLHKFSLQNLLRQFFCGVVFFVPLWLFARTRIVEILGVEKGNTGVYLAFAALASVVGTIIYHLEKNLYSYPLMYVYEKWIFKGNETDFGREKGKGKLTSPPEMKFHIWLLWIMVAVFVMLVLLECRHFVSWPWIAILVFAGFWLCVVTHLLLERESVVPMTMKVWKIEYLAAKQRVEEVSSLDDKTIEKYSAAEKIATWSDFIHCVQSCCFAWIFGSLLAFYITGTIVRGFYQGLTTAFMLLAAEMIIDAHRYRFVRYALQNSCQKIDSQTFIAKTSEREKKSPDESIFTQNDKYDSPKDEDDKSASIEMVLPAFEYKIEPEKINMMTTERLCELLENDYKSAKGTANKKIIFGILSFVKTCLGDDVLLRLLQKMEKCGDSIAWAADVTNKSLQEQEEIRVPNGNLQQARYYRETLRVCDKSYLVSEQWYSCKGDKEQTIKALLDMVVDLSIEELHSHIKKQ